MSTHFCKVGRINANQVDVLNISELEKMYLSFIEEAYNLLQTDSSLSDILYFEAEKLKKRILNLKKSYPDSLDMAS
ncbi:Lacal_2735 family protein [Geojedonia litorea]|uniref:Lacal_2735 family protein n=1 Tax=Geojedonia litorea TaxID=1268269 RepID=A0ABV9N053_9FLAO